MGLASQTLHNSGIAALKYMRTGYSYYVVIRKDYVNKSGLCALNLRVVIRRKKKDFPLFLYANPNFFNEESGLIEKNENNKEYFNISDEEVRDLNLLIRNEISKATEIFIDYRLTRKEPSLEDFERQFVNYDQRESFLFHYKSDLDKRSDISESTRGLHKNTYEILKEYKADIKFMDLSLEFLNEFNLWLKRTKKHNNNTRVRELRDFHQYILRAIKSGIRIQDPFVYFKWPSTTNSIVFLEQSELRQWTDYFFSSKIKPTHKRSLRYFLFMCYTSLRISDAKAVLDNIESMVIESTLVFVPIKTTNTKGELVRVPLTDIAKRFLKSVKGNANDEVADTTINKDLKEIAEALGTKKNISSKVGRHTFATIFLERGGKVEVLKQILGHSDMEDTLKYVHVTSDRERKQINEAFDGFHVVKTSREELKKKLWGHIPEKSRKKGSGRKPSDSKAP